MDEFAPTTKTVTVGAEGKVVHPLYTNVPKFAPTIGSTPSVILHRKVVEWMKAKMGPGVDARVCDDDEMINGFGTMSTIVMSTGCGYIQKYFKHGKKELFEELPQEESENGELEPVRYKFSEVAATRTIPIWDCSFVTHLKAQEYRARHAEAIQTFWTATNKDELVSKLKAAIGKTRVFVQPGLELTLLTRKYFGNFIDAYKARAGFNLCHGIGMDKDTVWGKYLSGLREVGDNGFDVDYGNYDGTVHGWASEAFLEVVENYYPGTEEEKNARASILHSIVSSVIIAGREVIEKAEGNCSGNAMTDVYNSITNWYNVLLTYLISRYMGGKSVDFDEFDDHVRCLTYGDDVIISASDETLIYFNRAIFHQAMKCMGMEVTSADKTSVIIPFEPLEQLTFLKSPFVERDQYVAAPLPVKVIHRELQWEAKQNVGDCGILKQKVEVALQMMAHHGKEAVDNLVRQLGECGYQTSFDFKSWEWGMRSKQELARVDEVWLKVREAEVFMLGSEENPADAWEFERVFDVDDEGDERDLEMDFE